MPSLKHPLHNDEEAIIEWLEVVRNHRERLANGFYGPPTLWQTFQKHALGIIGGTLLWSAILYLIAFIRGVL